MKPRSRLSPLLEKFCLRISANESYQKAEIEVEVLTGVKVGHSTQQKLVLEHEFQLPQVKQSISEVSVDGGKVRLRGQPKEGFDWKDYKAIRIQGIYYAAFFDDNQSLIDYVNSQPLVNPLVCLGDGHDGVWNIAVKSARLFPNPLNPSCAHLIPNKTRRPTRANVVFPSMSTHNFTSALTQAPY